jgi:FMN reductase
VALALASRPDGIILATQSYHGSMSGFIRNALDCTDDLRHDPRHFEGGAVGCVACADSP